MTAVLSKKRPQRDGGRGADRAADPAPPTLGSAVQDHLGAQLRALYANLTHGALPQALLDRIDEIERSARAHADRTGTAFRDGLIAALPALRGFARSLTGPAQADDLVQETLLKAWQNQHRFTPGTNLNAWLTTILRNLFYTTARKSRREVEDVDGAAAAQLVALPSQEHHATLEKVALQLRRLPAGQREALMLVAAQGMTYEAAATVLGCEVGTVKSRVSRTRAMLAEALGLADRAADRVDPAQAEGERARHDLRRRQRRA